MSVLPRLSGHTGRDKDQVAATEALTGLSSVELKTSEGFCNKKSQAVGTLSMALSSLSKA